MKVRERARGRCSLCQSWQIGQLPVRCDEEGRRGRRGRLKDPWQAGKRRRQRRSPRQGSALVVGRSRRTLFWRWTISYLIRQTDRQVRHGRALQMTDSYVSIVRLNDESTDLEVEEVVSLAYPFLGAGLGAHQDRQTGCLPGRGSYC